MKFFLLGREKSEEESERRLKLMAKAENMFVTFSVTTFLPMGYYLAVLSLYLRLAQKIRSVFFIRIAEKVIQIFMKLLPVWGVCACVYV